MKKYEFRLQRVKRIRAVEEELARAQFGVAELEAHTAELRVEERRVAIDRAVDDLRGLQGTPVLAPASVITALGLVEDARTIWRAARAESLELRARAEVRRLEWQERKRAIEGLERLDARCRAEFELERDRDEALALDETATQRAARARRSASVVKGT